VSRRSIIRWEQCEVLPRTYELNLVTTFLRKHLEKKKLAQNAPASPSHESAVTNWAEIFQVQHGDLVRSLRRRRKQTPQAVADHMGVSYSTYMRWEQSKSDPPAETWRHLLQHLQATEWESQAINHLRSAAGNAFAPRSLRQMKDILFQQDETLRALQFSSGALPTELLMLDHQAKLCSCLSMHPDFRLLLGRLLTYRGLYLSARGRHKDAVFYAQSGLQCLSSFSPEHQWLIGFWVARGVRRKGRMKWLFSWAESLRSPELHIEAVCQLCDCAIEDCDYDTAAHFMSMIKDGPTLSRVDHPHLVRRVQSTEFALAIVQGEYDTGFSLYGPLLDETDFPVEKALLMLHGVALEQLAGEKNSAHRTFDRAMRMIDDHSLESLRDFAKHRQAILS